MMLVAAIAAIGHSIAPLARVLPVARQPVVVMGLLEAADGNIASAAFEAATISVATIASAGAAWSLVKSKESDTLRRRCRESINLARPMILRRLLSEEDILQVYGYAEEVRDGMLLEKAESRDRDDEADDQSGGWVRCSSSHEKLFLHHGGRMRDGVWRTFPEVCSTVMAKLLEVMRSSPLRDSTWQTRDSALAQRPPLNVRCVEFHKYTAGGGLTDTGHIDIGSALTMSVQLSQPGPVERGGRFTTTDADGIVTVHELARGDAVIFCSESVHNVMTVASGTRNSLVVELWKNEANAVDRSH